MIKDMRTCGGLYDLSGEYCLKLNTEKGIKTLRWPTFKVSQFHIDFQVSESPAKDALCFFKQVVRFVNGTRKGSWPGYL